MSTTILVLLGLASVAVILALIIKGRTHPFIALLLVSVGLALAAGIPMEKVVPALQQGMGKTLGSVALIVTLGAMLGRIVEVSGGADVLANRLLKTFGPRRAPWALGAASFIFGIPVFVDVATIVLVPIVLSVARRLTGRVNMLVFALPTVMALLTVHVVLPPHPGIVGGSELMGADVGMVLLLGLIPAVIMWLFAQVMSGFIVRRVFSPVPVEGEEAAGAATNAREEIAEENLPSMGLVLAMILIPLLLIMGQTVTALTLPAGSWVRNFFALIGASPAALLIGVLLAIFFLGFRRGWSLKHAEDVVASALPATAAVILITGAGGTFGFILAETGVAKAVADVLSASGLPILVLAWLMAALIRAAQGSATVATITTAPLIAPLAASMGLAPLQVALVAITIGIGSMALSHVNDSLFWVWSRYFGVSTSAALKSYTVTTTATSVVGFFVALALWPLVSALS
ncbi:gluconate:H+ symporter [Falsarthrobacter nasiphocae]|uniref:GntP family gluconate:H+ symporter n=1 Tax=Falsarthrobacter nasiphocae TaxID=189863 RepID=A0AAE3YF70_9MICC|nr:gluconate:H+ symporter [Falsarthrobacter nasiphocae]MDR6892125.1 GntP family gluconate:H+ symporter [Falsarthrobacter nasiphocae]